MCTRLTGWRKSSYSHFEENACVEVRHEEGVVGIRDTKQAGAHRPQPQPGRSSEDHERRQRDESKRDPRQEVELAEHVSDERDRRQEREMDVRDARDLRRPLVAVDVDEEIAGQTERDEVHRGAADDLVDAQVDRPEGEEERNDSSGEMDSVLLIIS